MARKAHDSSCLSILLAVVLIPYLFGEDERSPVIQTEYGELTADETWSGHILVTGDVYVPSDHTLTILPGTVVVFTARKDCVAHPLGQPLHNCPSPRAELIIDGELLAQGTETAPIVFTSSRRRPKPGDWGGIILTRKARDVTLRHITVEFGDENLLAYNNAVIENCTFRHAWGRISDCHAAKHWDVRIGLGLYGPFAVVRGCKIHGNTWGIHANLMGWQGNSLQIIENNRIYDNNRTAEGYDIPNGIHICCTNNHLRIRGNELRNNTWGIELGIGALADVFGNKFIGNGIAFVWYDEPGPLPEVSLCGNEMLRNGLSYIKLKSKNNAKISLSKRHEWFRCTSVTGDQSGNDVQNAN